MIGIFCCVLWFIIVQIASQQSTMPAHINTTTGDAIIYCGARHKIKAIAGGVLIPLAIISVIYPLMGSFSLDLNSLVFLIAILSSIYSAIRFYLISSRYEVTLTKDGITTRGIKKKPQIIAWKDVSEVSYRRKSIEIRTLGGEEISIHRMMNGFITLLGTMKTKIPESVTKNVFEQLTKLGFVI